MKKWKLKLNFVRGVPNLEKEVNRVYFDYPTMCKVIDFYTESGLLENGIIEIEVIFEYEENKYSF